MAGSRKKARQAALQALYQWQVTGQAAREIEADFAAADALAGADRDYFGHVLNEVPARAAELDEALRPHLDRRVDEIDPVERAVLRIGAFELRYHPEIPYKVVINEAVNLAKTFGAEHGHRFVNAVLDKLALELRAPEIGATRS